MIKLVAIDLDGTLFDDEKNISEANMNAIKKAKEMGVKVVIATGRPLCGVMPTLEKLGLNTSSNYVICYNGAKVLNAKTGEAIFSRFIDGKDLKIINNEAKLFNANIHAFKDNEDLITPMHNEYTDVATRINNLTDYIADFDQINDTDRFIKIVILAGKTRLDYIEDNMNEKLFNDYSVVRSSKIFLEFLNKTVDKGEALKALAKYLNIDIKDTMGIGDAGNDLNMILSAGVGVAMDNAFDYVKNAADYVTADNLHDGVAQAFYKFIFQ